MTPKLIDAAAAAEAVRKTLEVHPSRRLGDDVLIPVAEASVHVEACMEKLILVGLFSSSMRRRVRRSASLRSLAATRRGVSPA